MNQQSATNYRTEIHDTLRAEMEARPGLLFIGEDVREYGGAFAVSQDLHEDFPDRVINAPISENSYVGVAVGAALDGDPVVTEIMFMDFITLAMDQITNHASKMNYMYADQLTVPLVIRTPYGGYRGYGPSHSQTLASWFMSVPGLKVVAPSSARHVQSLLRQSIADNNPVLFMEHKLLYDDRMEDPTAERHQLDIGQAWTVRSGKDVSIITYGLTVKLAQRAAHLLAEEDIDVEIIDLITLKPYDTGRIFQSIRKTGKAVILEEGVVRGGIGAEICATIAENCLWDLDGQLVRVGAHDIPIPCAPESEKMILPGVDDVVKAVKKTLSP